MAHVLIVDDEPAIADLIKTALDMQGHTAETAGNGKDALDRIQKGRFDLVIMDRNMPKMGGIEALKIIRSSPQYQGLKVIMCTSASILKEVDEAFAAGASDYITKPLDLQALGAKVQRALNKK